MTPADIEKKFRGIVVEQVMCDPDEIKMDSSFVEDLGADSLDIIELVMAVEEEFEIEIEDEEAEKIKTYKDALDYISTRVPA